LRKQAGEIGRGAGGRQGHAELRQQAREQVLLARPQFAAETPAMPINPTALWGVGHQTGPV
jgi:hypothetical protein